MKPEKQTRFKLFNQRTRPYVPKREKVTLVESLFLSLCLSHCLVLLQNLISLPRIKDLKALPLFLVGCIFTGTLLPCSCTFKSVTITREKETQ
ncbi:hypothetical protein RJT34_05151 [Clitoria ternatea]|uniref:Uncharacterized protein n=1 Tax=Clitoria ternatea TaxID=43366 RepID=A0AAN9K0B7_CLITE